MNSIHLRYLVPCLAVHLLLAWLLTTQLPFFVHLNFHPAYVWGGSIGSAITLAHSLSRHADAAAQNAKQSPLQSPTVPKDDNQGEITKL